METNHVVEHESTDIYLDFIDEIDTTVDLSDLIDNYDASNFLTHHGIKGQKWGNRRFQYGDGSLTALGRVRYGVGAARQGAGKAVKTVGGAMGRTAKKAGHALRGKIAPTDEQLYDQYNKAKYKADRKAMKDEINKLKGKKKKLKDMSDQEVIDAINRYRNEKALKALQKDANKSRARIAIEEAARRGLADAVGNTARNALTNVGQKLVDSMDTNANKAKRERQRLTDELAIKSLSGNKDEAKAARKALDATERASKGKYKNNDNKKNNDNNNNDNKKTDNKKTDNNSKKTNDKDSKNTDKKNDERQQRKERTEERNRQREKEKEDFKKGMDERKSQRESEPKVTYEVPNKSTSDFFKNNRETVVTDAVRGVNYDVVSNHIGSLGSKKIKGLLPSGS